MLRAGAGRKTRIYGFIDGFQIQSLLTLYYINIVSSTSFLIGRITRLLLSFLHGTDNKKPLDPEYYQGREELPAVPPILVGLSNSLWRTVTGAAVWFITNVSGVEWEAFPVDSHLPSTLWIRRLPFSPSSTCSMNFSLFYSKPPNISRGFVKFFSIFSISIRNFHIKTNEFSNPDNT